MAIADLRSRPIHFARAAAVTETRGGRAGVLAALIMLAAQLLWRLNWSHNGVVQAFPEFVVAALGRLTPLSVFGAATENYGSLAKKSLFVAVLIGIVAIGNASGQSAGRLSQRLTPGLLGRMIAGLIVAAVLLLVTLVVVLPIAHLGAFASASSYTGDILLQLTVTFALFGVAWALLATPFSGAPGSNVSSTDEISRRQLLSRVAWGGAVAAAIGAVGGLTWRLVNPRTSATAVTTSKATVQDIVATARARDKQPTPTPVAQVGVRDEASLGSDVRNEPIRAIQQDSASLFAQEDPTALFAQLDAEQKITPVLTTVQDFYHVSKNLSDPKVGTNGWKLTIKGLVEKELELSYDDLVKRATTQKITTLCCISNQLNGDLISTAEWTGLPLMDLLNEAKVKPGVVDLKFHCADDYEDSIPLAQGMDPDTMIVVAMNGEPLPEDHGAPARMIVPGIYGMKNVKWLERIEAVDEDFKGYWQTRGWSDPAPNQIWGRIDTPADGQKIDAGTTIATGLASAGDRDIKRLEISLDDGKTWADAKLEPSLNPPFTWVRWAYQFEAKPGKFTMRIRATDGTGKVMEEKRRDPLPDGATGWPGRKVEVKG